jgi:hypothetical protein
MRGWSDDEIAILSRLRKAGASAARVAVALKRSQTKVRDKARELGIGFKSIQEIRKD